MFLYYIILYTHASQSQLSEVRISRLEIKGFQQIREKIQLVIMMMIRLIFKNDGSGDVHQPLMFNEKCIFLTCQNITFGKQNFACVCFCFKPVKLLKIRGFCV